MTYIKAHSEKEKDDYKMKLSIAHKIALWTRCDAKHFPDLKEVYEDIDKAQDKVEGEVKTPDKMLEIVKSLNIKFGGEG